MLELISRLLLISAVWMTSFAGYSIDRTGPLTKLIGPKNMRNCNLRPMPPSSKITIVELCPKENILPTTQVLPVPLGIQRKPLANMTKSPIIGKKNKPTMTINPVVRFLIKVPNRDQMGSNRHRFNVQGRSFPHVLNKTSHPELFPRLWLSLFPPSNRIPSCFDSITVITKPRPLFQIGHVQSSIQRISSQLILFPRSESVKQRYYHKKGSYPNHTPLWPFVLILILGLASAFLGCYIFVFRVCIDPFIH